MLTKNQRAVLDTVRRTGGYVIPGKGGWFMTATGQHITGPHLTQSIRKLAQTGALLQCGFNVRRPSYVINPHPAGYCTQL